MPFNLFKRSAPEAPPRYPGQPAVMDGMGAAAAMSMLACEAAAVMPQLETHSVAQRLRSGRLILREIGPGGAMGGLLAGHAMAGMRAVGYAGGYGVVEMHEALSAAAARSLAFVVNLSSRTVGRQAGNIHGGHDDYFAVTDTGVFQIFATTAQEAADLSLLAQRVAELGLMPGICAWDCHETGQCTENLLLPEAELVQAFLGRPADLIATPTPAQRLLFGETRRRLPRLFDLDRPLGLGGIQEADTYFAGAVSQRPFFGNGITDLMEQAFSEFGQLCGRRYQRVATWQVADADLLLVGQGSVIPEAIAAAQWLRQHEGIRVGVVNLRVFRPFPGDLLSACLKGKKAVAVLSRTQSLLTDDPPVLLKLRSVIGRSLENGQAPVGQEPWPGYQRWETAQAGPLLVNATYGLGRPNPSQAELRALIRRLHAGPTRQRQYALGLHLDQDTSDLPKLAAQQQVLAREFPALGASVLPRDKAVHDHEWQGCELELYAAAGLGGTLAGELLAQALASVKHWQVRGAPLLGNNHNLQPTRYRLSVGPKSAINPGDHLDFMLVTSPALLTNNIGLERLAGGGRLVIHSHRAPETLWAALRPFVRQAIKQHEIAVYLINARPAGHGERFAAEALVGAFLQLHDQIQPSDGPAIRQSFTRSLRAHLPGQDELLAAQVKMLDFGAAEVVPLDWRKLPWPPPPRLGEPRPPWTVLVNHQHDRSIFDAGRFWDSVGYVHNMGRAGDLLPDPFVSTGLLPAGSSAARDLGPYRVALPVLIAERCTACTACLAACPDSALPGTLHDVATLLGAALDQLQAQGQQVPQWQRLGKHLAREAYAMLEQDGLRQHCDLGGLLTAAGERVLGKVQLAVAAEQAARAELALVRELVSGVPVIRSERFFEEPRRQPKGLGLVFSLGLNADSCKGCGLCVTACPEAALSMTEHTDELRQQARHALSYLQQLPRPEAAVIARQLQLKDPAAVSALLLDPRAYYTLVGGDGSPAGSGVKTAVHLVTAAAEAVMAPRVAALQARLRELTQALEQRIRGDVEGTLKVNDFEQLGRRLSQIQGDRLDSYALADLVSEDTQKRVSKAKLERLTALHHELVTLGKCYDEQGGLGGRARLALARGGGMTLAWFGTYPANAARFPWARHLSSNAAATATGIFEGMMAQMAETFAVMRRTEMELKDAYHPETHDPQFATFSWVRFTTEERAMCPPLLLLDDSGGQGGAGFEVLSRLLRNDVPVKAVIIDTEGYAAPGRRLPGEVVDASTHEAQEHGFARRRDLGLLALSLRRCFVLQSTIGDPGQLLQGAMRAISRPGPAFMHILAPEPRAHGIATDESLRHARLAVQARVFPLLEYDPDQAQLSLAGNPRETQDWAGWPAELTPGELSGAYTCADWAARGEHFREHFRIVPQAEWHSGMLLVADYLRLPPDQRLKHEAFIQFRSANGQPGRASVSPAMLLESEDRLHLWHMLRELRQALADPQATAATLSPSAPAQASTPAATEDHLAKYHQLLTRNLLALYGASQANQTNLQAFLPTGQARAAAKAGEEAACSPGQA